MTSRERVLTALNRRPPDRPPRLLYGEAIGYVPAIRALLAGKCRPLSPRDYFRMDITSVQVRPSRLSVERFAPWHGEAAVRSGQVDEWGVWWKSGSAHHFAHIESPLRNATSRAELEAYPWPDLDQPYRYEGLAQDVAALHAQGFAVCAFAGSIFEQAWYVRGIDTLMMDMATAPDLARTMLERTAHHQRIAARALARAGVDIVITGDDVANQRSLMMSREMWRDFLKPLQTATVRAAKDARADVRVFYHSDGNVAALIPDLIETGIDILNPVQPECMDPARIKAEYGDRLSFWGTVSVQKTMPFGTPEDVRAEVRLRKRTVGRGGGLILAPSHVLGPETPWENIRAFFEAADEEGP